MKNKLKTICCLMLAVLCMASFSITAFASGGDETTTVPDAETATDPKEDIEIPVLNFIYTHSPSIFP